MGLLYTCAVEIRDGRLVLADEPGYRRAVRRLKPGKAILRLEEDRPQRSAQANRYYWGVVLALISEHTGYEVDELHEYFKQRFNPARVSLGEDESVIGGSTRKLDSKQFTEYVERIRRFAVTELSVTIPDAEVAA